MEPVREHGSDEPGARESTRTPAREARGARRGDDRKAFEREAHMRASEADWLQLKAIG